jgi:SAM-dependent methyltransferase
MIRRALDNGLVYRAWQRPFADQKFAPAARSIAERRPRSVLDVGCGPGINAERFGDARYLGVDLNPFYVADARRRYGDRFRIGDATQPLPTDGAPYDFVLLNSLLHHLDDGAVDAALAEVLAVLAPHGVVEILDLELPAGPSLARFLARHDRGAHPRPRADWLTLLERTVRIESFEPYALTLLGIPLWRMFHCRAGH